MSPRGLHTRDVEVTLCSWWLLCESFLTGFLELYAWCRLHEPSIHQPAPWEARIPGLTLAQPSTPTQAWDPLSQDWWILQQGKRSVVKPCAAHPAPQRSLPPESLDCHSFMSIIHSAGIYWGRSTLLQSGDTSVDREAASVLVELIF